VNQEHIFLVAKSAGYASFIYARLRDRLTCHLLWSAAALASNSRAPPEPFPPTKGVQGSRYPKHPAAFRSPLWQLGWSLRWPRTSSRLLSPPSKCAKHALRAAHLCAPWPQTRVHKDESSAVAAQRDLDRSMPRSRYGELKRQKGRTCRKNTW